MLLCASAKCASLLCVYITAGPRSSRDLSTENSEPTKHVGKFMHVECNCVQCISFLTFLYIEDSQDLEESDTGKQSFTEFLVSAQLKSIGLKLYFRDQALVS